MMSLIDRKKTLQLLGAIFIQTANGSGKVLLEKMVKKKGEKLLGRKTRYFLRAIDRLGLVTRSRDGLQWNIQDYGPPSMIVTDAVIRETIRLMRTDRSAEYRKRGKDK